MAVLAAVPSVSEGKANTALVAEPVGSQSQRYADVPERMLGIASQRQPRLKRVFRLGLLCEDARGVGRHAKLTLRARR